MLQETVKRCITIQGAYTPTIVCNERYTSEIRKQLTEINCESYLIAEPFARNTAPAIAIASFDIMRDDPDGVILVLPADHVIKKEANFRQCVRHAIEYASKDYLVTFGIVPNKPETGYGYIKLGEQLENANLVEEFVEKPDKETANNFLTSGNYVWNSGMFAFKASKYLSELKTFRPDIYDAVEEYFYNQDPSSFEKCPSESVDYAVMQKSRDVVVIPSDIGWSDVGSWESVWEVSDKDENGNVNDGAYLESVTNSYIKTECNVAVIGLDNIAVIEHGGNILIMNKGYSQSVKNAALKFE